MKKDKTKSEIPTHNPNHDSAEYKTILVSFESGHYKTVTGNWVGDSQWTHWRKADGKMIFLNKNKVEYYEEI